MFVLKKQDEPIEWPVEVEVPVNGGKVEKQEFTAHFKLLDQDEIDAESAKGDVSFMTVTLVGWGEDVKDSKGEKIPFGKEPLRAMTKTVHVRKAIVKAYYQMAAGIARKN
ncbi:MAG: hypothetical protein RPU13_13850 [Candidatus Sedimenticola sp. (ex Thyasira tokunagai)]